MDQIKEMQVAVSIVLYKMSKIQLQPILTALLNESEVSCIVLVDNEGCHWANQLNHERIFYIKSPKNGGYGFGHNLAMKHVLDKCEYFVICNPDIYFQPGTIKTLYRFAKQHHHRFIAPKIVYPDGRIQWGCRLLPSPFHLIIRRFFSRFSTNVNYEYELQFADYDKNFYAPSLSGCFMFIESTLLKTVGGFDTRYFMYMEDIDLCRKILSYEYPMFCSEACVTHGYNRLSYKRFSLLLAHIHSAILYFNKWGWFFDKQRHYFNQQCLVQLPVKKLTEEKHKKQHTI